jgi:hypothetical protein
MAKLLAKGVIKIDEGDEVAIRATVTRACANGEFTVQTNRGAKSHVPEYRRCRGRAQDRAGGPPGAQAGEADLGSSRNENEFSKPEIPARNH